MFCLDVSVLIIQRLYKTHSLGFSYYVSMHFLALCLWLSICPFIFHLAARYFVRLQLEVQLLNYVTNSPTRVNIRFYFVTTRKIWMRDAQVTE